MVRIIASGVAILSRYVPHTYDKTEISVEISRLVKKYRLVHAFPWPVEVRNPKHNWDIKKSNDAVNTWHRDRRDSVHNEPWLCMLLWSNREQTELQLANGQVIKPYPNQILLVKNTAVMHKTPDTISPDRWFARVFVREPKWMSP